MGERDKEPRYRRAAAEKVSRLNQGISVPDHASVQVINDKKADRSDVGEGAFVELSIWISAAELASADA